MKHDLIYSGTREINSMKNHIWRCKNPGCELEICKLFDEEEPIKDALKESKRVAKKMECPHNKRIAHITSFLFSAPTSQKERIKYLLDGVYDNETRIFYGTFKFVGLSNWDKK